MPIEDTMDGIVEVKMAKSEDKCHKFSLKATYAERKQRKSKRKTRLKVQLQVNRRIRLTIGRN
jgi:hypothetical protein